MSRSVWDEPVVDLSTKPNESITCHKCRGSMNHKIIIKAKFTNTFYSDDEHQNYVEENRNFEIIQCQGCMDPSIRISTWNSEDIDYMSNTQEPNVFFEFFPKRNQLQEFEEYWDLPLALSNLYTETITAINNDCMTIAGIGVRGLIETICNDQEIRGDNLKQKIDNLFEEGKISKDNKEILQSLREIYNKSAHKSFRPSREQLLISLSIMELLLKQIYIHPTLAKKHFPNAT